MSALRWLGYLLAALLIGAVVSVYAYAVLLILFPRQQPTLSALGVAAPALAG